MDLLKKSAFSRSLFKKQKADPEFLSRQGKVRLSLLKNLARAIKEAQLLYATREGGAPISDCRATQRLCSRFEAVLRHGLKAGWFGQSGSFWPLVLRISRKQAIEYISSLQYAQSDSGRCRAWIRLAVNECSLESYISVLCQDSVLLGQYYESYSFLHDEEMVEAMRQLLAGLTQLEFHITVDTASLEFEAAPEALQPALRLRPPEHLHKPRKQRHRSPGAIPQEHKKGSVVVEDSDSEWSSCEEEEEEEEGSGQEAQATSTVSTGTAVESSKPWEQEREQRASSGEPQAGDQWGAQMGGQDGGFEAGEGWDEQLELVMGDEWDEEPEAGDKQGDVHGERAEVEDEPSDRSDKRLATNDKQDQWEAASDELEKSVPGSDGEEELKLEPDQWPEIQGEWPEMKQIQDELPEVEERQGGVEMRSQQDERKDELPRQDDDLAARDKLKAEVFGEESLEQPDEGVREEECGAALTDGGVGVRGEGWGRYNPSPDLLELPDSLEDKVCKEEHTTVEQSESSVGQYDGRLELYVEDWSEAILAPVPVLFQETSDGSNEEAHVQEPRPTPSPIEELLFTTPPSTPPALYLTPSPPPASVQKPLDSYSSPAEGSSPKHGSSTPSSQDYEQLSHASSLDWSVVLEEALGRPLPQEEGPIGLLPQENYFTPEKSLSELQRSIGRLKKELSSLPVGEGRRHEEQEKRKRVVQLQLQLQKMKEESLGHQFMRQPRQSLVESGVCEGCGKSVKGLLRSWYKCIKCSCVTHKACLARVSLHCMATKEESKYELRVCPERGLTYQHFRCALCNRAFTPTPQPVEARLCDYSGLYYCPECHHNDLAIIPARVVHNWDFSLRKVSSHSASLLERLASHPLIRVQQVNPLLYTFVQDLVTIESLRHDILLMKEYFVQCREALAAHLLQKLDHSPHFKDTAQLFSLRDLEEAHSGRLLPQLQEIHRLYAHHIKHECLVCSGKGYYCELCGSEEVLYPFDRHASVCSVCRSVFHKTCLTEMASCPKCARAYS